MKYVWIVFEFKDHFHSVHKTKRSAKIMLEKDEYAMGGYCEKFWLNDTKLKTKERTI